MSKDNLVINLEPYLIPLSLIIGAIIISLSTFFSFRNLGTPTGIVIPEDNIAVGDLNPDALTSIDDDPYLGNKDAKVVIVEFSDYECPYCKQYHANVFDQVVSSYVDTGKVLYVFRDYIAVTAHNPAAKQEALAASCVAELAGNAKYFEFHDLIFTNTGTNGKGLGTDNRASLIQLANSIGVNQDQFTTCIDSNKYEAEFNKDNSDANSAGANGTPAFVIGRLNSDGSVDGSLVSGSGSFSLYQTVIDKYLAE